MARARGELKGILDVNQKPLVSNPHVQFLVTQTPELVR